MVFIPRITVGEVHDFDLITNGSDVIATLNVGFDDITEVKYVAFTSLSPCAGGNMEHVFCLHLVNGTHISPCWSGADSKMHIPTASDRSMILGVFCAATELLIEVNVPEFIVHSTYSGNLPVRALAKHEALMRVFEEHGYEIAKPNEFHGRHVWFAERKTV